MITIDDVMLLLACIRYVMICDSFTVIATGGLKTETPVPSFLYSSPASSIIVKVLVGVGIAAGIVGDASLAVVSAGGVVGVAAEPPPQPDSAMKAIHEKETLKISVVTLLLIRLISASNNPYSRKAFLIARKMSMTDTISVTTAIAMVIVFLYSRTITLSYRTLE